MSRKTKLLDSEKPIENISQFFQQLRIIIRYHVMIESYTKILAPKDDGLTNEKCTKICYTLHLSSLMSISSIIIKIQEYEKNREKLTDWESSMFEMQYEEYLKDYNINFKEEIERKYKRK